MLNRLKIYSGALATVLEPGERPLALRAVAYFAGEEDLGQARPTFDAETLVASIRRAPRLGQAGRIWVLFADGSATSLMLGILSPGGAKAVVNAWGEIAGS